MAQSAQQLLQPINSIHTLHVPHKKPHYLSTPQHQHYCLHRHPFPEQLQELQLSSSTPTRVCFGAGTVYASAPSCSSNGRFSTSISWLTCGNRTPLSA